MKVHGGTETVRAESVAHFSHRVRHLRLDTKTYGVTMSETRSCLFLRSLFSSASSGSVVRRGTGTKAPRNQESEGLGMGDLLVRSSALSLCAFWFAGLARCQCIEVHKCIRRSFSRPLC